MNDSERDCEFNAVVLMLGAVAALAVAGIVGRAVYAARHSSDHVRNVAEIISDCQSTITQMDRALHQVSSAQA